MGLLSITRLLFFALTAILATYLATSTLHNLENESQELLIRYGPSPVQQQQQQQQQQRQQRTNAFKYARKVAAQVKLDSKDVKAGSYVGLFPQLFSEYFGHAEHAVKVVVETALNDPKVYLALLITSVFLLFAGSALPQLSMWLVNIAVTGIHTFAIMRTGYTWGQLIFKQAFMPEDEFMRILGYTISQQQAAVIISAVALLFFVLSFVSMWFGAMYSPIALRMIPRYLTIGVFVGFWSAYAKSAGVESVSIGAYSLDITPLVDSTVVLFAGSVIFGLAHFLYSTSHPTEFLATWAEISGFLFGFFLSREVFALVSDSGLMGTRLKEFVVHFTPIIYYEQKGDQSSLNPSFFGWLLLAMLVSFAVIESVRSCSRTPRYRSIILRLLGVVAATLYLYSLIYVSSVKDGPLSEIMPDSYQDLCAQLVQLPASFSYVMHIRLQFVVMLAGAVLVAMLFLTVAVEYPDVFYAIFTPALALTLYNIFAPHFESPFQALPFAMLSYQLPQIVYTSFHMPLLITFFFAICFQITFCLRYSSKQPGRTGAAPSQPTGGSTSVSRSSSLNSTDSQTPPQNQPQNRQNLKKRNTTLTRTATT